jgi:hypothetical protein
MCDLFYNKNRKWKNTTIKAYFTHEPFHYLSFVFLFYTCTIYDWLVIYSLWLNIFNIKWKKVIHYNYFFLNHSLYYFFFLNYLKMRDWFLFLSSKNKMLNLIHKSRALDGIMFDNIYHFFIYVGMFRWRLGCTYMAKIVTLCVKYVTLFYLMIINSYEFFDNIYHFFTMWRFERKLQKKVNISSQEIELHFH